MVQSMSLGGGGRSGVAISASSTSASVSAASVSGYGYGAGLGRTPANGNGGTKEAPDVAVISPESQTESYEEQSVEMTERKTLLIRTVKTDDMYESDTQECTITISGAADDTDED
ncbi:hypothetical protein J4Q44_G00345360 [Coregonus suidteri]|uniref:Uncharacterized protein n=2 Tax=Coregonus TaxID=27772 RepID=A0AAN8Q8M8_9TELE